MKRRGFTLIELLVVIAIIALLMAILIPALARARKQAKAVICQAKLKQWGMAFAMYMEDHKGTFTGYMGGRWMNPLKPYYSDQEKLMYCPMATRAETEGGTNPFAAWGNGSSGSYVINEWLFYVDISAGTGGSRPATWYWRNIYVKGTNNIPIIMDGTFRGEGQPFSRDEPPLFENEPRTTMGRDEMRIFCLNRHDGAVNGLFMDWSVRRVGLKGLWKLKWHRTYDINDDEPVWPRWMLNFGY
ncbi:MAG: type II secretion system protein [Planctomycetota bacterium]